LALRGQTTWSLSWYEEFSGNALDQTVWNYDIGTGNWGWGNNELQYYTNSSQNLFLENGMAHIVARQQNFGTSNYTSARINTSNKFNFTYGRLEARIKLPMGQGLWPAFWLLGQNINEVSWPSCGEIDVMEHVNNNDYINGTLHWNQNGHQYNGSTASFDPNAFHQYMIEWDENQIKWFIDGISFKTMTITSSNMNAFHSPFFIILNLAVGGQWPGSPDNTTSFPAEMLVDYIRYYQPEVVDVSKEELSQEVYIESNKQGIILHNAVDLIGQYEIYNLQGQIIDSGIAFDKQPISTNTFTAGIYVFKYISKNQNTQVFKVHLN
jgi:beta-glucanase (GH16 family)